MAQVIHDTKPHTIDRLLRCRRTHRYFREGQWTTDAGQASVFRDEIEAARACVVHRLSDVDLVLRAQGTSIDLFTTQMR